jgi:molecular chaperone Hsp33
MVKLPAHLQILRIFDAMNKKQEFMFKDRIIRGITDDGHFRISVVKTTEVVKAAVSNHQLSTLAAVLLGRTLTATLLLATELKGEERIRLTLQGNGPIGMIIAEANAVGECRGYVQEPQAMLNIAEKTQIGDGLGIGLLTFSKTLYNEAKPITGTVELRNGNITEDIAFYLMQSEQIPSAVTLDVGIGEDGQVTHAGGILVQALPGAPEEKIDQLQQNLQGLIPLSERFSRQEYIDDLLAKVTRPDPVHELGRLPVHFFCRCTRDRFLDALALLNLNDLEHMQGEDQELVCHYCSKKYVVTDDEISSIIRDMRVKMN